MKKDFNYLCHLNVEKWYQIDGLVQERCNSIANALELHLSCNNPSKCKYRMYVWSDHWIRQIAFHNKENKHDFIKTETGQLWNLSAFV